MIDNQPTASKKYHAFISYRHADNKESGRQWATWLHQALETYEVPTELVGKTNGRGEIIPSRIYPVFRDEQELPADADLGASIKLALEQTNVLVVLCSPQAVASTYVAEEIDYFKKLGHSERIIAAIIDGEPNASWDSGKQELGFTAKDECFPKPLQVKYDDNGLPTQAHAEPIAADFRINNDGKPEQGWTSPEAYKQHLKANTALDSNTIEQKVSDYQQQQKLMLLKIVAGILGIPLGELTQRDKAYQLAQERLRAKKLRRWVSALIVLTIFAIGAGGFAYMKQQEAERQTVIAEQKTHEAKQQKVLAEKQRQTAEEQKNIAEQQTQNAKVALINANHNYARLLNSFTIMANEKKAPSVEKLFALNSIQYAKPGFIPKESFKKILTHGTDSRVIFRGISKEDISDPILGLYFDDHDNQKIHILRTQKPTIWNIKTGKEYLDEKNFWGYPYLGAIGKYQFFRNTLTGDIVLKQPNYPQPITLKNFLTVNLFEMSEDKRFIVTNERDTTSHKGITKVKIQNIQTGETIGRFDVEGVVFRLAFISNDKVVFPDSYSNNIMVYDIAEDRVSILKELSYSGVESMISNNGKLVVGTDNGEIKVWDFKTQQKTTLRGHFGGKINHLIAFGNILISASSSNGILSYWNLSNGQLIETLKISSSQENRILVKMALSQNQLYLALAFNDDSVEIWDNQVEGDEADLNMQGSLQTAYSPNGQFLSNCYGNPYLYDVATKHPIEYPSSTLCQSNVAFIDDTTLVFADNHGSIVIYNTKTKEEQFIGGNYSTTAPLNQVQRISLSPNKDLLTSEHSDGSLRLWNLKTMKNKILIKGANGVGYSIFSSFSSDGKQIAINTEKGAFIYEVATDRLESIPELDDALNEVVFSPDNQMLAFATDRANEIQLFNIQTKKIRPLGHYSSRVNTLLFSDDGKYLFTGDDASVLRMWDTETGAFYSIIAKGISRIDSISISPDNHIAVVDNIWDLALARRMDENPADFANIAKAYETRSGLYLENEVEGDVSLDENRPPQAMAAKYPKSHLLHWLPLAEEGDSNAMLQLGIIEHRDSHWEKAKEWYEKARDAGNPDAEERLRILSLTKERQDNNQKAR